MLKALCNTALVLHDLDNSSCIISLIRRPSVYKAMTKEVAIKLYTLAERQHTSQGKLDIMIFTPRETTWSPSANVKQMLVPVMLAFWKHTVCTAL